MATASVGNPAGLALLVLNVAGVPGLIKSIGTDTPKERAIGFSLAMAVGAASSVLGRTPWPILGTAAMCALVLHLQHEAHGDSPGRL
jgi:hypothetical protein